LGNRVTARISNQLVEAVLTPEQNPKLDDAADDQHEDRKDDRELGKALASRPVTGAAK
jgi:hypothetical protein